MGPTGKLSLIQVTVDQAVGYVRQLSALYGATIPVVVSDTLPAGRAGTYDPVKRVITIRPVSTAEIVAHEFAHHLAPVEDNLDHGRGWVRAHEAVQRSLLRVIGG